MSYLNAVSMIHTIDKNGEYIEDYPYEKYERDITLIESSMYHEINQIADEMSIDAIHALSEGIDIDSEKTKNNKKYINTITKNAAKEKAEKTINQIIAQYNKTHNFITEKIKFIESNKKDIENITISSNYTHYNGKCKKISDVKTYENILKKFKAYDAVVDKSIWLGESKTVTADYINKKKDTLMKNILELDNYLTKNKDNTIRSIEKDLKFKNADDESNSANNNILRVKIFKSLCKNITIFCNETMILLNKFISYEEGE